MKIFAFPTVLEKKHFKSRVDAFLLTMSHISPFVTGVAFRLRNLNALPARMLCTKLVVIVPGKIKSLVYVHYVAMISTLKRGWLFKELNDALC